MFGRKQVGDADGTTGGKLVKTLLGRVKPALAWAFMISVISSKRS